MLVKRTTSEEVNAYQLNDIVDITLNDGEEIQAMAVRQENNNMLFILVDCLAAEFAMNDRRTNTGGYDACDLRVRLNNDILDRFPADIREKMVAFDNGDFLRLPTEKEIFGENPFGADEPDTVEQFEAMKLVRNRIAFQGKNGEWEWYWLQNPVEDSATNFAYVHDGGYASTAGASPSFGVRPCFLLKI